MGLAQLRARCRQCLLTACEESTASGHHPRPQLLAAIGRACPHSAPVLGDAGPVLVQPPLCLKDTPKRPKAKVMHTACVVPREPPGEAAASCPVMSSVLGHSSTSPGPLHPVTLHPNHPLDTCFPVGYHCLLWATHLMFKFSGEKN